MSSTTDAENADARYGYLMFALLFIGLGVGAILYPDWLRERASPINLKQLIAHKIWGRPAGVVSTLIGGIFLVKAIAAWVDFPGRRQRKQEDVASRPTGLTCPHCQVGTVVSFEGSSSQRKCPVCGKMVAIPADYQSKSDGGLALKPDDGEANQHESEQEDADKSRLSGLGDRDYPPPSGAIDPSVLGKDAGENSQTNGLDYQTLFHKKVLLCAVSAELSRRERRKAITRLCICALGWIGFFCIVLRDPRKADYSPIEFSLMTISCIIIWYSLCWLKRSAFRNLQYNDSLINALGDEDPLVRAGAATRLARPRVLGGTARGCPSAVPSLITALEDENSYVRASAAWALGRMKDTRAVGPLVAALGDEDSEVQDIAAWALENTTSESFGRDHEKWRAWWEQRSADARGYGATTAVSRLSDEAVAQQRELQLNQTARRALIVSSLPLFQLHFFTMIYCLVTLIQYRRETFSKKHYLWIALGLTLLWLVLGIVCVVVMVSMIAHGDEDTPSLFGCPIMVGIVILLILAIKWSGQD